MASLAREGTTETTLYFASHITRRITGERILPLLQPRLAFSLLKPARTQSPISGQSPKGRTPPNDLRATVKLRALIADPHLQVRFLDQGIHDEEQRTGIFDVATVAYSTLARNQRARRDNLLVTIRMLEEQMAETEIAA
jgi:hypothetical protein